MDLPVSVVDNDRSPVSRQIIRDLNAGPHADVKAIDNNLNTSLKRLASAQDYALLYVPTNFEADALRGVNLSYACTITRCFMRQELCNPRL